MKEFSINALIGLITGVLFSLLQMVNEVIVVLAILMIMDYFTGVAVAFKAKCFSPADGIWGIVKKSFYSVVLGCGFIADYIYNYMATNVGAENFKSPGLVGLAVALFLISNEGLSIGRNLIILGIPFPDILTKAFGYIRDEAGNLVKLPTGHCKPKPTKKKVGG